MFCYKRSRGSDGGWSLKRERCSQSIFLLLFLFKNSTDVMMLWCCDAQLNISLIKVCKIPFFWIRKAKLRRSVVLFPLKRGNKRHLQKLCVQVLAQHPVRTIFYIEIFYIKTFYNYISSIKQSEKFEVTKIYDIKNGWNLECIPKMFFSSFSLKRDIIGNAFEMSLKLEFTWEEMEKQCRWIQMPLRCIDPGAFFPGHMRNLCFGDYMTNTKLKFESPERIE